VRDLGIASGLGGRVPSPAGAIIVAAGESTRMDGIDKIFTPVLGKPLIAHTLEPFLSSPLIAEVVLVLHPSSMEQGQELLHSNGWTRVKVVPGGKRRQDSVWNGLQVLPRQEWVVVHDGARPCLDEELIDKGLRTAQETGAAIAAIPARDTMKEVDLLGMVVRTHDRDRLTIVQTPQVFRRALLEEAFSHGQQTVTDEATMVEVLGRSVKTFMGSYANIKVTTPEDLIMAEIILARRRNLRTGSGES